MRYIIQYGKNPDAEQTTATLHAPPPGRNPTTRYDGLATAIQGHFTRRTWFRTRRPDVEIAPVHELWDVGFFVVRNGRHTLGGQWAAER